MAVIAFRLRTVRGAGAVLGSLLGMWVYVLAGPRSFVLLAIFFVLGSLVTRMGWAAKESRGLAEKHRGARGGANILANGGPVAVLALGVFAGESSQLFFVGIAGAIAAALADTASSEVGQVYGSSPVSLTVFKKVPIGTPGAVSFEGTIAGLVAAVVVGLIAAKIGLISLSAAPFVVVAAVVASGLESVFASFLRVEGHHVLNFLNVSLGACMAMALWVLVF
jgi:uncharacterized protein (TIGR00297 family)